MILTDYYRFERLPIKSKSKSRIDCTASTKNYNPLEVLKNKDGELFLYVIDNTYTKAGKERKADLALTKTTHLSSLYHPDVEKPFYYGDMRGTSDALLIVAKDFTMIEGRIKDGAIIEIFIARGMRNDRIQLYNLLTDGEFDDEMDILRKQIIKSVTGNSLKEENILN